MAKAWKQNAKNGRNLTNLALSRLVQQVNSWIFPKRFCLILSIYFTTRGDQARIPVALRSITTATSSPPTSFWRRYRPIPKTMPTATEKPPFTTGSKAKRKRHAADPATGRPQRAPKGLDAPWWPVLHEASWRNNLDALKRVSGHGWRAEI